MGTENKNFSIVVVVFVLLVSSVLGSQAIGIVTATVLNPLSFTLILLRLAKPILQTIFN